MELDEFKLLSPSQQNYLLQNEAVYLGEINENTDSFLLFQLDIFYVEIYYRKGEQLALNLFDETESLDPYLEMINIDSIYHLLGLARD